MLHLQAVSKHYPAACGGVDALCDVSLRVGRGEICAVAGPSGSGKSTLLAIMGGLDRPSSGRVRVDGRELSRMSARCLTRFRLTRVGFVFQTHNLIPVLTAAENIALPLVVQGVSVRERRRRVGRLLGELGLTDVARRRPPELSGGQRQRVGVARALAGHPVLVLADEPTSSLDQETGLEVMDVVRALNQGWRTTFVFSTHDPLIESLATRHVRLRSGRVAAQGSGLVGDA